MLNAAASRIADGYSCAAAGSPAYDEFPPWALDLPASGKRPDINPDAFTNAFRGMSQKTVPLIGKMKDLKPWVDPPPLQRVRWRLD
jgi:hypothetical protein